MTKLYEIHGTTNSDRAGDVLFVHGLDGDAISTWHPRAKPDALWPNWLGQEVPQVGVWSLEYDAASIAWKGSSMPLSDRATNVLAAMEASFLGTRPLVIVAHSLGGLLVKQLLRHANDFGQSEWKEIAESIKGIVFLATPHSGSNIANWLQYAGGLLQTNATIKDLQAHDSHLRNLNLWFRNNVERMDIKCQVYFEKQKTAKLLVVDETSSDPGLQNVIPIPVDSNHIDICKPESTGSIVYARTSRFIRDCFDLSPQNINASKSSSIKYFYYISKAKLDMLKAQFSKNRSTGSSEFSTASLTQDMVALIASLNSTRQMVPFPTTDRLTSAAFYADCSDWHSGLFSLNWMGNTPTIVYTLFREFGDSLVLLVGSPNNILGDKVISSQYFVPGTSGAQMAILDYVAKAFKVDEPVAVTVEEVDSYGYDGPMPEIARSEIRNPFRSSRNDYRAAREPDFLDSFRFSLEADEQGRSLAVLCLSQLVKLPSAKLDLAFRVFSSHAVLLPSEPPEYDFQREYLSRVQALGLAKYKMVYLGSPLYTALA
jgi:PGAP1-like protein